MKEEFDDRKGIDDFHKKLQELREQDRFSGIGYQFSLVEENMIRDFARATGVKHTVDKGTARENVLRNFLVESGYLPDKFKISEGSSHIISTTGHTSKQIDLLIYDTLNTPKLMALDNIQYFPVECVYGTIEVKSNLDSKDTISGALNNIKSFKELRRSATVKRNFMGATIQGPASQGFGILFAYDATLKWKTVIECIEEFQENNPSSVWPNLIIILNQGYIGQLKEIDGMKIGVYSSEQINGLSDPKSMFGSPQLNFNLLTFYLILMDLLNNMTLPTPPIREYVHLKKPSGKHSYSFGMGGFTESGKCAKHGNFLRKISEDNLEKIITTCDKSPTISWQQVFDIVQDKQESPDKYKGQVQIKLYNPVNHDLADLLFHPKNKSLMFDDIEINEQRYFIPFYYSELEGLISECPNCKKKKKKTAANKV